MESKVLSTGVKHSHLPPSYVRHPSERPRLSDVLSIENIPVIDLGSSDRAKVIQRTGDASHSFGFFQVINHGISVESTERMLQMARDSFHLPLEEKMKFYSDDRSKTMRLSTSFNVKKETVHNWTDYLRLHCHSLEDYQHERPSNPSSFKIHGESKVDPRSRSLERGSRAFTTPTSPTHPRLCGTFMESPTGKNEGQRSPSHPLPLPPVSPTRTTNLQTQKNTGSNENSQCYQPKWRKGKLLGRGTFGQVYVGFNSESGQMCAIKEVKVIADDKSSNECLKQLNQEIKMLSQLSHPNIVQYYGSELGEDALSVYLEYVSGGSIQKLLQEYGPFKEPVIQNYARQILFGLAYLHGKNTLHRDIKGANILVGPNGEITLADFGMAKHITSHTSMLSFKGSPYWMAPEVIMNISGYNLAVDIWSLGCTVIEMATTKPPWSQYEGVAAIFKIGNSKDMPNIPDHLSSEAKSFINLCLQRDPSARPTAVQLLDHPFIRNQAVRKVAKNNVINDGFPSSIDGGYRQIASELHSNKARMILPVEDCSNKPKVACSRASSCSSDGMRLITSLPVSPCSSPLREHRSCLYSPPHLAYSSGKHSSYAMKDYSVLSTRPNKSHPADLWGDMPQVKVPTPEGSPRAGPIRRTTL